MLQPYVSPAPVIIVGGLHAFCLLVLVALLRTRPPTYPGWRVVKPGGLHWFCFWGSWGFSTLLSWVWLFVGSARRDAEAQMLYALVLVFAFGGAAVLSGIYMIGLRRMVLRWRGASIRWRAKGSDLAQDMGNFHSWRQPLSGLFHLRFRDGTVLKLDLHAQNAEDLAVAISNRTGNFNFI